MQGSEVAHGDAPEGVPERPRNAPRTGHLVAHENSKKSKKKKHFFCSHEARHEKFDMRHESVH